MVWVSKSNVALEVGFSTTLVGAQLAMEGGLLQTFVALVARQILLVFVSPATNAAAEMSNISK